MTLDYHIESRISNESYKLELVIRELIELGLDREAILDLVADKLEDIEDEH